MHKEIAGYWRFAISKKFRCNMKKIALRKMLLKLDARNELQTTGCGTFDLNADCPFCVQVSRENYKPFVTCECLAPAIDAEWYAIVNPRKDIYKRVGVIGCYILPYCERGYRNYQNIKAWMRRANIYPERPNQILSTA